MTLQRAFRKDERIIPCALTSDRLCQLIAQLTLISLLLSAYFVQLISVSLFCQLKFRLSHVNPQSDYRNVDGWHQQDSAPLSVPLRTLSVQQVTLGLQQGRQNIVTS